MNQKDFNLLLTNISNELKNVNQLLYQCFVLIIIYYFFKNVMYINPNNNHNHVSSNASRNASSNNKLHKSFIYLIFVICVIIDWFIWNNYIQTTLFASILIIYIIYNINTSRQISTFINYINDDKMINDLTLYSEYVQHKDQLQQDLIDIREQEKLNKITFVPKDINFNKNINPNAYDKKLDGINDLDMAYNSKTSNQRITDSKYSDKELNNLYNTSQYKNINDILLDKPLSNDIYNNMDGNIDSNMDGNMDDSLDSNIDGNMDKDNLNLFRNPKKVFLDDKWLSLKTNTYNDNCKDCLTTQKSQNTQTIQNKNKNAICSLVEYGSELEECTNQDSTITNNQLVNISTNKIEPIYKF